MFDCGIAFLLLPPLSSPPPPSSPLLPQSCPLLHGSEVFRSFVCTVDGSSNVRDTAPPIPSPYFELKAHRGRGGMFAAFSRADRFRFSPADLESSADAIDCISLLHHALETPRAPRTPGHSVLGRLSRLTGLPASCHRCELDWSTAALVVSPHVRVFNLGVCGRFGTLDGHHARGGGGRNLV